MNSPEGPVFSKIEEPRGKLGGMRLRWFSPSDRNRWCSCGCREESSGSGRTGYILPVKWTKVLWK